MESVATCLRRERVQQKAARGRIARSYQPRDDLEVELRLLLGPTGAPVRQRLQTESIIAPRMAHDTASVTGTLFQKDRLDARPIILEVKRLSVTGHTVFPRRCQPIFLIAFSDSFFVCPADGVYGAREWDRILACVGTSGIPTAEEQTETGIWNARQRRPGGLRVLSPRPPLKDFTKEMGLILTWRTG